MAFFVDALVLLGVAMLTAGVYGMLRGRDTYLKLHAVSATAMLGSLCVLVAAVIGGGADIALRAALIAVFLLMTAPISMHAISKAAYQRRED